MTDDVHAPTVPEVEPQTTSKPGPPLAPDARYAMRGLLGRGGMGEVWLAHDLRIDREVAIKVMRGESSRDPDAVARFLREARVQGRLEHPAIVPVHDLGSEPGAPYFAMKRLTGTTLGDVLEAQRDGDRAALERWTRRTLLARIVDVCHAIALAHSRGVIHRDLKPANIMLGDLGETYVLDWGLARIGEGGELGVIHGSDLGHSPDSGSGQTRAGAMMGTPGYMSPEQMRGERVDARSDIYAVGCMLFEILVGEPAISQDTPYEATLAATSHRPSTRRADAELAPELDDLCARATAASPEDRPASARELGDAIQRFLDGDRDLARRRELAANHAERARRELDRQTAAGRAEAMREAGRAIVLDPENQAAKALLARLLLEPPREVPAEVRAEIANERDVAARGVLRKAGAAYTGNLALLLVLKLVGVGGTWPFVSIAALLLVMIVGCFVGARRRTPLRTWEVIGLVTAHGALIGLVGVVTGPLLLAPLFALSSLPLMVTYPGARLPAAAIIAHVLALAVPLALEVTGVLPHTFGERQGVFTFTPWALDISPTLIAWLLGGIAFFLLVVNALIATTQRAAQEAAEERVHVTSWHLRQLVR